MFRFLTSLEKTVSVEYDAISFVMKIRRIIFLFVLFFCSISFFSGHIYAQATPAAVFETPEMTSSDTGILQKEQNKSSEYALPYPGMLPTNPLYFLKSFRDSLIGFIIADPLKKAEFELLQADKKLASAQFLLKEPNQEEMAVTLIGESANHSQTAFQKLKSTDTKSTDSQAVFQKMAASLSKHSEILSDLAKQTRNDTFTNYAEKASALHQKVIIYL